MEKMTNNSLREDRTILWLKHNRHGVRLWLFLLGANKVGFTDNKKNNIFTSIRLGNPIGFIEFILRIFFLVIFEGMGGLAKEWRHTRLYTRPRWDYKVDRVGGIGRGWNGWYNERFFRSLLELSYMIYLDTNGIKWESAECSKYSVEYVHDDKIKTYYPDFYLLETATIIEVKPKALIDIGKNKAKFEYARKKYGDLFKVITEDDLGPIDPLVLFALYKNKNIVWMEKYETKFINYLKDRSII